MKVSVLMSVYNGERWLAESIESVLNQTFTDFEFLIVNDGSTDGSGEIINRYAEQDSRIFVFDKPNTGLADSLNYGIARAKGEWIARIDADDVCEQERLQKQLDLASHYPNVVLIGSGLTQINELGEVGKKYWLPVEHKKLVRRLLRMRPFFAHSSAFYKTEAVQLVGGYRTRIKRAQDYDLWLRLSEKGELACISKPLIKCRKHADQVSHEEGGRRQLVDSHVAITSYWLRRSGVADPVDTGSSDNEFDRFCNWVAQQLELNNLCSYHDYLQNLRQQLHVNNKSFSGWATFFYLVFSRPSFVLRYVREGLVGKCLGKRMSTQWMELARNRAS